MSWLGSGRDELVSRTECTIRGRLIKYRLHRAGEIRAECVHTVAVALLRLDPDADFHQCCSSSLFLNNI